MIQLKIPGKLYLAGEYGVLYPGVPALIFSVDRFMHLSFSFREEFGTIQDNNLPPIVWRRDSLVNTFGHDDYFEVLFACIGIVDRYLLALNQPLKYVDILVQTHLKENETKLGLGSSAAISVGIIKGLLRLYDLPYTPLLVYKLAVLAHIELGLEGSFGDIASCSFTGLIKYTAVDRFWLQSMVKNTPLLDLLKKKWPLLAIESLPQLDFINYLIGWTQTSASTQEMVKKLQSTPLSADFEETFQEDIKQVVDSLVLSVQTKDVPLFQAAIVKNRQILQSLAQQSGLIIETKDLSTLIDLALDHGGVAKSSGAGGGDCGLAFFEKDLSLKPVLDAWRSSNIQVLPLTIYEEENYVPQR